MVYCGSMYLLQCGVRCAWDGDLFVSECEEYNVSELRACVAALEHDLQEVSNLASHDLMEPLRTITGFGCMI